MSLKSQYATSIVIISNLGSISHRLAAIARSSLQGHPRSMISI